MQLDYTYMHDPRVPPQRSGKQQTYTIFTAIETTAGLCTAVLTSKTASSSSTTTSLDRQARLHKQHLTVGAETSLMQLVNSIAADLNLPTRASPPYSHQSQGKVERLHRNLFDQLRSTRLQWSRDLKVKPHMLPPESLPWALQCSTFILNNYLLLDEVFLKLLFQPDRRWWQAAKCHYPKMSMRSGPRQLDVRLAEVDQ